MGFLDRLVGRPAAPDDDGGDARAGAAAPPPGPSTSEVLQDLAPHTSGGGGAPAGFPGNPASAARLYDPYEGISTAVGGRKHAFSLPEGPEFVFQDEAAARRRGWGENLQFYTGVGYLGGAAGRSARGRAGCAACSVVQQVQSGRAQWSRCCPGGSALDVLPPPHNFPPRLGPGLTLPPGGATGFAVGGYKYLSQGPAEPALSSAKLKANRLINMSGSLGRRFACASAILGLYFASFESLVYYSSDGRLPDGACTSAAGAGRGASGAGKRGPGQGALRRGLCQAAG
jgi:hypothetical protein